MAHSLTDQLLEPVAERFRVLGDPTRLAILRLLLDRGELNVGDISEALASSQANISKHLRTLHSAGMVSRRPEGTAAFYAVADSSITRLCEIVCDRIKTQVAIEARSFDIV